MPQVELVPITVSLLEHLAANHSTQGLSDFQLGEEEIEFTIEIGQMTIDFEERVGSFPPWTGYLAGCTDLMQVVGTAGFKGHPTDAGIVEIGYATFARYEGLGYGKAMAGALVEIARKESVQCIQAHTLKDGHASQSILKHNGFSLLGDVRDPEDGIVLRWQLLL